MSGLIINPRGTSGSGKTELARRIMAEYGWRRGAVGAPSGAIRPLERPGCLRPLGYRLQHPLGNRPLTIVGHYERTSGGCDAIRLAEGGMQTVIRVASEEAAAGCDVLIEGSRLSSEYRLSGELARAHRLHVICLVTPSDECVANLMKRRRARQDSRPRIATALETEVKAISEACRKLMASAAVENLAFASALERARALLGLPGDPRPAEVDAERTERRT